MSKTLDISVIIPVTEHYRDLTRLHNDYSNEVQAISPDFEFIYVIDGQHPDAIAALQAVKKDGAPITIIQFAKWFGEATALNAGFEAARGHTIVTLPAYYQVVPQAIGELVETLRREDVDMTIAARQAAGGRQPRYLQRRLFNWLVSRFTTQKFSDLGCSARAMRRRVTSELTLYGDQHRFLPILCKQMGFRVREIPVEQHADSDSRTFYGIGIYIRRLLDIVTVFFLTKFTKKPLRFFGLIGSFIAAAGAAVVAVLIAQRLFADVGLADRPALMLGSLLIVLGVQFFAIGLIGELIIFTHAQHIKEFQIAETVNMAEEATARSNS